MNWAWAASLDQIWRSPNLPIVPDAGHGRICRDHRSDHAAALGEIRGQRRACAHHAARDRGRRGRDLPRLRHGKRGSVDGGPRAVQTATAPLPQLSCIDELAGDAVLVACEKALFGSAESVAAAVAYAASQITLLTSLGDVATANKGAGSDLLALRRAVERDRYGLMAYVLTVRDRCTPSACRAFRSLTEHAPDCGQHGRSRL